MERLSALAGRQSTGAVASVSDARARRDMRRAHLRLAHAANNPAPAPATPQLPLPVFDMASVAEGLAQTAPAPLHETMPFRPPRQ